ncbi:sigma-70 family RNA polymerase sigma factor [bacterium]|nr:MAG: sigma-70 family RNA polymerase sigma factor [bacterium]
MSKLSADEFVRRTADGVYALALRLTGNAADAWDLAQDALLRAVKSLDSFRGDSDPRTWVYRITVNAWKNRAASAAERMRRASTPLDAGEAGAVRLPAGDPPADVPLERGEAAEAVRRAVAALEPEDRACLQLREFDGLSYEEIASALDVPVGTVKSRLHRARLALAKALEEHR